MSLTYDTMSCRRENERLTYVSSAFDTGKNAAIYNVIPVMIR